MKLSIIMDRYDNPLAGTESQVLKLVEGLRKKGWTIRFAVFKATKYSKSGRFPVPIEELGIGRISDPRSWFVVHRYGRVLAENGFGVVHVFFNDASVICPPMMRLAGLKTLISRRDMGFWYSGVYLRALRLTDRFAHGVVCNSKAVAHITAKVEGVPESKLHVIYNGYPEGTEECSASGDEPNTQHNRKQRLIIGIVANLRPIKRIEDLIEAVAKIHHSGRNIELRIVGGGDEAAYRRRVEKLGIAGRVKFLGSQPDPERHIQDFDIAVLCSETEGFSNSIIEYMRCGKPVVCTDTGGNPEIIDDGVNGYLVGVGDVASLADRLEALIDNPDRRLAMGRLNKEQLVRRYSLESMLNQYIRLYHQVEPGMAEA
ncbi:glycosyltransferase family 4 protein [Marinobacter sp. DUT-1]|uniref:glycosyltransferase family 4 protein n=1 Tax=Marinobacter sp. DUT-1 TaxID=3412037 RepID=UPI003D1816F6